MSTIDAFYVVARDAKQTQSDPIELAKFFDVDHANAHAEKLRAAQRGWTDVVVVKREETIEDQHPAHRAGLERARFSREVAASPASPTFPDLTRDPSPLPSLWSPIPTPTSPSVPPEVVAATPTIPPPPPSDAMRAEMAARFARAQHPGGTPGMDDRSSIAAQRPLPPVKK